MQYTYVTKVFATYCTRSNTEVTPTCFGYHCDHLKCVHHIQVIHRFKI